MWTQTFVLHMLRTEHVPFAGSRPAASLTVLTLAGVAVVTALPYVPGLGAALGLSPLPLPFFGLLFGCTGYPSDVFRNRSIFRLNKVTADDGIE